MSKTPRGAIVVAVLIPAVAALPFAQPASANRPIDSSRVIQVQAESSSTLAAILNRSCGDCHSNTMVPGWYTKIPPFSTVMARGSREGRKAVNFSEWSGYTAEQQRTFLTASCKDVTLGKMPMKTYLRLRPDAQLSAKDVETICSAAQSAGQASVTFAAPAARRVP